MQEIGLEVELGAVATALSRGSPGRLPTRVIPPRSGSLARRRDHRIDKDQGVHSYLASRQRRSESPKRLRDEYHSLLTLRRGAHPFGVLGQTSGRVIAWHVNGDGLPACLFEQLGHAVPVPGSSASPRDQDECVVLVC